MSSTATYEELYKSEKEARVAAEAALLAYKQTTEIEIKALKEVVALLVAEVEQLKSELAKTKKNSKNSNKPPSSDGYIKPSIKNSREKSGKKSGGQEGHEGTTLFFSKKADTVVELKPIEMQCDCGGTIIVDSEEYTVRQVVDIEQPAQIVIEYRQYEGMCDTCGKIYKKDFPEQATNTVVYGENLKAIITYLTQYQLIPLKRTTELMNDLFSMKVSQGTVMNATNEAHQHLEAFEDEVKKALIGSDIVHFDETGLRVGGKLQWLHSASAADLTFYTVHKNRGQKAMDAQGILPTFTGVAIHDHWKSYYRYTECSHAECNAHHIRHLRYLHEDLLCEWAGEMTCLLLRIKEHVALSKAFSATCMEEADIKIYEEAYKRILEAAIVTETITVPSKKKKKSESELMVKRLTGYSIETLSFMYDFSIPFDNNQAERDIRMPKAKQKISGCIRTELGASAFARTRSFISTCKKMGKGILDGLRATFDGNAENYLELSKS